MAPLIEYIRQHTKQSVCKCNTCSDPSSREYKENREHTIDMFFFDVSLVGTPDAETFKKLIKEHQGVFNEVDPFDGFEHGYRELGGWLDSQELALHFMALGEFLKLWCVAQPMNMLGIDRDSQLAKNAAGSGMVSILNGPYESQQQTIEKAYARFKEMPFPTKIEELMSDGTSGEDNTPA